MLKYKKGVTRELNIYDIAKKADVSIATVSRTLNGGPVKKKTKEKILQIIEEEGYVPNAYAKNLNSQSVKIVGVLLPDIEDIYGSRAVAVLQKEMKKQGYDMLLYNIGDSIHEISRYVSMMLSRRIDALFVVGSKFQESPALEALQKAAEQISVIGINADFEPEGMYSVLTDDRKAITDVVLNLYSKGHRRFLYLYDTRTPSGMKKLGGFCEGISKVGLDLSEQIMCLTNRNYNSAKETVCDLLKNNTDITAIICAQDELAVGAVKACIECGYNIPEDIAVTGYDNSCLSYCSNPEITSVDNLPSALGAIAADIFKKVTRKEPVEKRNVIDCTLINRETT